MSRRKGQVGCRTLPEAREPLPSPWKVEARGPPVLPCRAGTMGRVCVGCGDVDRPNGGSSFRSLALARHRATARADARPCSVRVMPFPTPHQHGLDLLLRRRAHLRVEEDRNEGAPGEEDVVERVRVPAEEAAERHATSGRLMRRTCGREGEGGGGGVRAREEKGREDVGRPKGREGRPGSAAYENEKCATHSPGPAAPPPGSPGIRLSFPPSPSPPPQQRGSGTRAPPPQKTGWRPRPSTGTASRAPGRPEPSQEDST